MISLQASMRLDEATIDYFKKLVATTGIPYQSLMNLYVRECAAEGKELELRWAR